MLQDQSAKISFIQYVYPFNLPSHKGPALHAFSTIASISQVNLRSVSMQQSCLRLEAAKRNEYPCNMSRRVGRNLYETVCRQMQTN